MTRLAIATGSPNGGLALGWGRHAGLGVLAAMAVGTIAALVLQLGALPVLTLMVAVLACGVMLARPQLATLLTVFFLYANVPATLTKEHGVPPLVAGSFILLLAFPLAHALVVRREPLKADSTFAWMLAFLALLAASTLQAVDPGLALDRVWQYVAEGLLLYWLVINAVRDLPTLRKVFWTILAAASLVTLLSFYQEATGLYAQEFWGLAHRNYEVSPDGLEVSRRRDGARAQGPVDEPNRFAQIMIVLVPLAGFLYRSGSTQAVRGCAAIAGALTLAGVGLTLSRGAFVTLALMAVAMVVLRWIRPWHAVAGALVLVTTVATLSPLFLPRLLSILDARHLFKENVQSHQTVDGAIRGRTTEMLAALRVFRDYPVLGVGPGQFAPFYFHDYSRSADIKFRDVAGPRRAHDLYLELGAEGGLLGLGVFMAIVLVPMARLWRLRRHWHGKDREAADLSAALWLSLFAYLSTAVFLHLSYQRYYWFLLALAGAGLQWLQARVREETPATPARAGAHRAFAHAGGPRR